MRSKRIQRSYDHRLRKLVRKTGDIDHATRLGIPRSTARGWLKDDGARVVTLHSNDPDIVELHGEVSRLRRQVVKLRTFLRLLLAVVRTSGCRLKYERLENARSKLNLLRAIVRVRWVIPLRTSLRAIGISISRYQNWKRLEQSCELDDRSSCPKLSPNQLTDNEVGVIKEMVTSEKYRHVPTGTLAMLAQRLGKVFASPSTWHRLMLKFGWRRPRLRVHPVKPKIGHRATRPNQTWHIDATIVRLLDGTKVYIHAVIDNFSRRILDLKVSDSCLPLNTITILLTAARSLESESEVPSVITDGGSENVNLSVDELISSRVIRRVLAQVDVRFSNSLIEAWWRSLKHQWLFLNSLDSIVTVRRLVEFYVSEHNSVLPHSAFTGETPDEVYFGKGGDVCVDLIRRRKEARGKRMEANQMGSCRVCDEVAVEEVAAA